MRRAVLLSLLVLCEAGAQTCNNDTELVHPLSSCDITEAQLLDVLSESEMLSVSEVCIVGQEMNLTTWQRVAEFMLKQAPQLIKVKIRSAYLRAATLAVLPLASLSSLTEIDLSGNKLGDDGMEHVASALPHLQHLSGLKLQGCHVGQEGVDKLAAALPSLTGLKTLNLRQNVFSDCTALANSLASLPSLVAIDMRENLLGVDTASAVMGALDPTELRELRIQFSAHQGSSSEAMEVMASRLGKLTGLTTLSLQDCMLGAAEMTVLTPGLSKLTSLETLDLRENELRQAGAAGLAPVFAHLQQLRVLDLSWTQMRAGGMGAIAARLCAPGGPAGLTHLYMQENELGLEGTVAFTGSCGWSLHHLQTLDLRGNQLGDMGAAALAPGLGNWRTLDALRLRDNGLRDVGLQALALSIRKLPMLSVLDLQSNEFADYGIATIAKALSQAPAQAMTTLILQGNRIANPGAKALAATLIQLPNLKYLDLTQNRIADIEPLEPILQKTTLPPSSLTRGRG